MMLLDIAVALLLMVGIVFMTRLHRRMSHVQQTKNDMAHILTRLTSVFDQTQSHLQSLEQATYAAGQSLSDHEMKVRQASDVLRSHLQQASHLHARLDGMVQRSQLLLDEVSHAQQQLSQTLHAAEKTIAQHRSIVASMPSVVAAAAPTAPFAPPATAPVAVAPSSSSVPPQSTSGFRPESLHHDTVQKLLERIAAMTHDDPS
jgi:ABC-type transporter Mla subunit MlaD